MCSTGLIGIPLPIDAIVGGVPAAGRPPCAADGGADAAEAIRTTDTVRKEAVAARAASPSAAWPRARRCSPRTWPRCWPCSPPTPTSSRPTLQRLLPAGVADSFNALVVDGCTSTNDTVILLASGEAGPVAEPTTWPRPSAEVCADLAEQMAGDAEGATKVVRVTVTGARVRRRGRPGRPRRSPEPAVQVLVVRPGPLLGPDRQRARQRRHRLRPGRGRRSPTAA